MIVILFTQVTKLFTGMEMIVRKIKYMLVKSYKHVLRFLFVSTLFLTSYVSFGQFDIVYEIDNVYALNISFQDIVMPEVKKRSTLKICRTFSKWIDDSIYVHTFNSRQDSKTRVISEIIYKNYADQSIYEQQLTNTKGTFSKGEKRKNNWQVDVNSHKYILGMKCLKATSGSMNNQYIGWFAEDLNYSDGPESFAFNLPGVIMELQNTGTGKSYKAIEIIIRPENAALDPPQFKIDEKSKENLNMPYINGSVPEHHIIDKDFPINKWVDIRFD